MEKDIEKEYSQLCKKYKLPKFEDIVRDFEISDLETQRFLIQNILRKIRTGNVVQNNVRRLSENNVQIKGTIL